MAPKKSSPQIVQTKYADLDCLAEMGMDLLEEFEAAGWIRFMRMQIKHWSKQSVIDFWKTARSTHNAKGDVTSVKATVLRQTIFIDEDILARVCNVKTEGAFFTPGWENRNGGPAVFTKFLYGSSSPTTLAARYMTDKARVLHVLSKVSPRPCLVF